MLLDLKVLPDTEPQVPTITLALTLSAVLTLCQDHMATAPLTTSSSWDDSPHGAWQRVCQLQQQPQQQQPQQQLQQQQQRLLPSIPGPLFDLLGMSQQLVAWLAAVTDSQLPMKVLCSMWCNLLKVPHQQQPQQPPHQQQQQQLVVHMMLSTV
jgi:hypothetical protein